MKSELLRNLAIQALDDLKGIDITTINVRSLTTITDYMIMCTGTSKRHIKSLAENVAVKAKQNQSKHVRVEGNEDSEWVLVDLGDVVVHVMLPTARAFYSLEDLWEPIKEGRGLKSNS